MRTQTKPTTIKYEDLTARIFRGNYGEYRYKSPRWGYKRAYKYNQVVYVYIGEPGDSGWIEVHHLKNANRLEIINWLKEFKQSRKYQYRLKQHLLAK